MRPILVVNPRSDAAFAQAVDLFVNEGVESAEELERLLRDRYPYVVVRDRGLSAERVTWYVYREGRWTPSET